MTAIANYDKALPKLANNVISAKAAASARNMGNFEGNRNNDTPQKISNIFSESQAASSAVGTPTPVNFSKNMVYPEDYNPFNSPPGDVDMATPGLIAPIPHTATPAQPTNNSSNALHDNTLQENVTNVMSHLDTLKSQIKRERESLSAASINTRSQPSRSNGNNDTYMQRPEQRIFSPSSVAVKVSNALKGQPNSSLRRHFSPFDTDLSGHLSYPSFKSGLSALGCGLTETERERFTQWIDENDDGLVSMENLINKLDNETIKDLSKLPVSSSRTKSQRAETAETPQLRSLTAADLDGDNFGDDDNHLATGSSQTPRGFSTSSSPPTVNFGSYPPNRESRSNVPTPATLDSNPFDDDIDEDQNNYNLSSNNTPSVIEPKPITRMPSTTSSANENMLNSQKRLREDGLQHEGGIQIQDSHDRPPAGTPSMTKRSFNNSRNKNNLHINTSSSPTPSSNPQPPTLESSVNTQSSLPPPPPPVSPETLMTARGNLGVTSREYGLFSPVAKTTGLTFEHRPDRPATPGTTGKATLGTSGRRGSYIKNGEMSMYDTVGNIISEDKVESERMENQWVGNRPSSATRRNFSSSVVPSLLSGGPQPHFTSKNSERSAMRTKVLHQLRTDNQMATKDQHHKAQALCYRSHLGGAGVEVTEGNSPPPPPPVQFTSLQSHLQGGCLAPSTPVGAPQVDYASLRTSDINKTTNMVVSRLSGSGSVPALKKQLEKYDGSRSGLLNRDEFKVAMGRYGIEMEEGQIDAVMKKCQVSPNTADASKKALQSGNGFNDLNQKFMEYGKLIDDLDKKILQLEGAGKTSKKMAMSSALRSMEKSGYGALTERSLRNPEMHQGRRMAKKVLHGLKHHDRENVERVLSTVDSSGVGKVTGDEIRSGMNKLGLQLSDKELSVLTEQILKQCQNDNQKGDERYKIEDILPSTNFFLNVCEAEDHYAINEASKEAESKRKTEAESHYDSEVLPAGGGGGAGLGGSSVFFHSNAIVPEIEQNKVPTKREIQERLHIAHISKGLLENDIALRRAWANGDQKPTPECIRKCLSEAGIQLSDKDAKKLSSIVIDTPASENIDKCDFDRLFKSLNIRNDIKTVRVDSRTGKGFNGMGGKMNVTEGVVRGDEEADGGIFSRSGVWEKMALQGDTHFGSETLKKRLEEEKTFDLGAKGNTKGRGGDSAEKNRRDSFFRDSVFGQDNASKLDEICFIGGNKRRPATPDTRAARDNIGVGMMVHDSNLGEGKESASQSAREIAIAKREEGRLSPELVGNKKALVESGLEMRIGSENNVMIAQSPAVVSEGIRLYPNKNDNTAHGNPYTHSSKDPVVTSPNKRSEAPSGSRWADTTLKEFIVGAGGGAVSTPLENSRPFRKRVVSAANQPSFGLLASPFATDTDVIHSGENKDHSAFVMGKKHVMEAPLRDSPLRHRNEKHHEEAKGGKLYGRPPPFAVEGDKPTPVKKSQRFEMSERLYGYPHGYNIISNLDSGKKLNAKNNFIRQNFERYQEEQRQ